MSPITVLYCYASELGNTTCTVREQGEGWCVRASHCEVGGGGTYVHTCGRGWLLSKQSESCYVLKEMLGSYSYSTIKYNQPKPSGVADCRRTQRHPSNQKS